MVIEDLMHFLDDLGWQAVSQTWQELKTCPDLAHLHRFHDQLSVHFEG